MDERRWSGPGWSVNVSDALVAAWPSGTTSVSPSDAGLLNLRWRWLRRWLYYDGQRLLRLRRISKCDAHALRRAIDHLALAPAITTAVAWYRETTTMLGAATAEQRWVPSETTEAMLAARPPQGLLEQAQAAGVADDLSRPERAALELLEVELELTVAETNASIMEAELVSRRGFFARVERTPLTEEQAKAVVCFDNRVQVLAAAGSGKTSVMVARAAYAVARGFVHPEHILLLAFNKSAADELQERVEARFAAAGTASAGVKASTFHSFGLGVIGQATGTKPRLASWLEKDGGLGMVEQIVDGLRDRDPGFRYRWDLYRLLFARAPLDIEVNEPDGWDADSKRNGYRTAAGDIVRSHGERLVADFLYFNGVSYEYEKTYPFEPGSPTHGPYKPDFYYPGIDAWHEHWALRSDGTPPPSFVGYAHQMEWKRQVHARHRTTTLIETTWADVLFGDGLARLGDELARRGLALDWDPDRPPKDEWATPMKHEAMHRLVRTFMAHQKSGSLTREAVEQRFAGAPRRLGGYRTRLFLGLYWEVATEWERRLATEGAVDFEDMLVQAAGHLEAGRASSAYELVLVDELQDASQARARLVRALVSKPGRYLLAVGDDWQSINRFAGADLSAMTDFAKWFGRGPQLALTTTFRCPPAVCDVASSFVSKNPRQFAKPMRSAQRWPGTPVDIIRPADPASAVADYLERLFAAVKEEEVPRGPDGTVSVHVLGRYNHEAAVVPRLPPYNLDVTFLTVHRSKGLEADYVVVPGMTTGTYGFPSTITDDPVLGLAMPTPDTYEHAEERRLLYVALTRARRAVTLITDPHRMSPFVIELIKDGRVTVDGQPTGTTDEPRSAPPGPPGGAAATVRVCPGCKKGVLVRRKGRYGPFLGCSSFPRCTYTCHLEPEMPSSEDSYDRRVQPPRYSRQRGRGSTYHRWH